MLKEFMFSETGVVVIGTTVVILSMKVWLYRWIKRKMDTKE